MTTPAHNAKLTGIRARSSAQAQAAARELIITSRFICTFDPSGRLQMAELNGDGAYIQPAEIPALIASGTLPRELLLAILAAVSSRLGVPGSEP
ncbi:hypothetical protein ACIPK7_05480 [Pseudomonas sp. NPDC086581]|uniref:hypothetical protein n=1 Tax=Pseudomonas sp. NPDC086581 TaxID=3364432 RepID=UPI00382D1EDA